MTETTDTPADSPTYPDVHVQLLDEDGNVFVIIGRVSAAIRRAKGREAAETFARAASACQSYDEVLQLVMGTVVVS